MKPDEITRGGQPAGMFSGGITLVETVTCIASLALLAVLAIPATLETADGRTQRPPIHVVECDAAMRRMEPGLRCCADSGFGRHQMLQDRLDEPRPVSRFRRVAVASGVDPLLPVTPHSVGGEGEDRPGVAPPAE